MTTVKITFHVPLLVDVEEESIEAIKEAWAIVEDTLRLKDMVFQAMDNGDHTMELVVVR